MHYTYVDSPLGPILAVGDHTGLKQLNFERGRRPSAPAAGWKEDARALRETSRQLTLYFEGKLTEFSLELDPDGTPFQQSVWDALQRIPYGEITTYGELARTVGRPTASRAVGAANGANPLPIVIPCHRVIGASGKLTGYGGGLDLKQALLDLELEQRNPRLLARM